MYTGINLMQETRSLISSHVHVVQRAPVIRPPETPFCTTPSAKETCSQAQPKGSCRQAVQTLCELFWTAKPSDRQHNNCICQRRDLLHLLHCICSVMQIN